VDSRVRRAPDPEWVLMYRRGLSRSRIADLVRAPARTVAYHQAIPHPGPRAGGRPRSRRDGHVLQGHAPDL
jgi:hypothetical protein